MWDMGRYCDSKKVLTSTLSLRANCTLNPSGSGTSQPRAVGSLIVNFRMDAAAGFTPHGDAARAFAFDQYQGYSCPPWYENP